MLKKLALLHPQHWFGLLLLLAVLLLWIVQLCRPTPAPPPAFTPTPRVITPVPLTPSAQADRVMFDSLNALHP